jgi:hypothetical protein
MRGATNELALRKLLLFHARAVHAQASALACSCSTHHDTGASAHRELCGLDMSSALVHPPFPCGMHRRAQQGGVWELLASDLSAVKGDTFWTGCGSLNKGHCPLNKRHGPLRSLPGDCWTGCAVHWSGAVAAHCAGCSPWDESANTLSLCNLPRRQFNSSVTTKTHSFC